ncbi:MAG: alpha,alpha-trehalase TreA [Chitinophagaceae bacterium]
MATKVFYIESLGQLYEDVQMQKIFPDSKFFVDCIPNHEPGFILQQYQTEKTKPGFNLKEFVEAHFILPSQDSLPYSSANKPILEHLDSLWNVLMRKPGTANGGTLIPLPKSYVVPGGRFREVYYWDSYFTMLGLQVSKRFDIIQDMIDNFAYLINTFGFIPNANRTYYLTRSQPPFFTMMVELLAEEKGDEVLLKYQQAIEKEYAFWMEGAEKLNDKNTTYNHVVLLDGANYLNRYWDKGNTPRPEAYEEDFQLAATSAVAENIYRDVRAAAASGWDFSTRWFKDGANMSTIQTTNLVPVDLNCLLLHMEEVLQKIYAIKGEKSTASLFASKSINRKKAIQHYCWNNEKGFYFDYNFETTAQTNQYTLAGLFPLFFSIATKEQADAVAKIVEEKFLQPGGVVTTLNNTKQQWDMPNGWAPLQWITYKGLKNYGHQMLANEIKNRWMKANERVYTRTGKMMEKYDVTDTASAAGGGEYPNQDGFGWTNGVYLKFSREE